MQVWNVLHAARWKCRGQKTAKNATFEHHRTTLSGYIFANKARIDNRKKLLNSNVSPRVLRIWYTSVSGWDLLASLGHPNTFQRVSRLVSVTARYSSSRRQPKCGVEQRALPRFGRAAITLSIGPHSSLCSISQEKLKFTLCEYFL